VQPSLLLARLAMFSHRMRCELSLVHSIGAEPRISEEWGGAEVSEIRD
jgi:hypothetical protein